MTEYLIRVGELTLKGKNRNLFEKKLIRNIRRLLDGIPCTTRSTKGRFFLGVEEKDEPRAEEALRKTFGIVAFSKSVKVNKSIDAIVEAAVSVARKAQAGSREMAFKVWSKRSDKSFPLSSHEIETIVGEELRITFPLLRVDLSHPELLIRIEVREAVYIYGNDTPGPSGLPVGSAGSGVLLLSGGIDSPVAGYFMAKRGLKLDAVYFDSYPYTSVDARKKVEALARVLSPYNAGLTLFIVPFTELSLHIRDNSLSKYATLLMRACMMEIGTRIAKERGSLALITGDSLSQVASQTVESLRFADAHAGFPVFRPLVGFDKLETIAWAKRIESYDTSILPFDDCCTVFTPEAPSIRPKLDTVERQFDHLHAEELIAGAIAGIETKWFEPFG